MTQWEWDHTKLSVGSNSNFHFPSSSLWPGLLGASRRHSPVLPLSPPRSQEKWSLDVVSPGHWRLDNKAKVINWWWLDSNSRVHPDMSQCHIWSWHHHKSQMIFWHYATQTNFHLTPSPATHALHEPEPTYWANSWPIHKSPSRAAPVANIPQPSCGLWSPGDLRSRVFVFRKCYHEARCLYVAEGHSRNTKILWIDDMTNILGSFGSYT